jgi:hypothetical protein
MVMSVSDRGFLVKIDRTEGKVLISFEASKVAVKHADWLGIIRQRVGLGELNPHPYWGFGAPRRHNHCHGLILPFEFTRSFGRRYFFGNTYQFWHITNINGC